MNMSGFLSGLLASAGKGTPFLAQANGPTVWMPEQAAEKAGQVDSLFYLIFWICMFFFTLLMAVMVIFAIRYRRKEEGEPVEPSPSHNAKLEVLWTAIPVALVLVIFYFGFQAYIDQVTPPSNAYEIQVTGQKWKWSFTYPNGYIDELLHVPADRPVRLVMTSEDVIHSMSIPAFRVKQDVVPGRYTKVWFTPIEPGQFDLYCAEYCGDLHSGMISTVYVHTPEEFDAWIAEHSDVLGSGSLAEGGERIYNILGCKQCHSLDGAPGVAPTFKDLYGSERKFREGDPLTADEDYVRESILDPMAKVAAGFEPVMPTFQGRIKDREITALIAFLKTLSVHVSDEEKEALQAAPAAQAADGAAAAAPADTTAAAETETASESNDEGVKTE